jgi:hypothetical protein
VTAATAPGGSTGATIFHVAAPGAAPTVYATPATLELMPEDEIDALMVLDQFTDEEPGAGDEIIVSLAPGSPSLSTIPSNAASLIQVWPTTFHKWSAYRMDLRTSDDLDALTARTMSTLGLHYCPDVPNSIGQSASIAGWGSTSVSENDVLLTVNGVPNEPGIFFFGQTQAQMPFGNGFRRVGGNIRRLPPVFATGNSYAQRLDLTAVPAVNLIVPGTTWHFQSWYRDPQAGGWGFNLSNALALDFVQ